jgi:TonB family protein
VAPRYQVADLRTQAPALAGKAEPEYTEAARRAGVEGTVILYAEIGADGRAHRVRVIKGLGFGLDAKAIESVMKNGKIISTPAPIEVVFRIKGSTRIRV